MTEKRLLLHLRHAGVLRHYGEVLGQLGREGHSVTIYVADTERGAVEESVAAILSGRVPGLSVHLDTMLPTRLEQDLTLRLRWLCDVLRYRHPDFASADLLRDRAIEDAPPGVARWARRLSRCGWPVSRAAIAAALALDRLLPPPETYERFLDAERPDLVLASPLLWPGSAQVDLLKAASRRGIPTGILIPSWDNLTNKGLLRYVPDRVFVWNDMQRRELERYHGVPGDRVSATGAPTFDRWFTDGKGGREEFCERVGLDPARPYVLYLASSRQVAPDEPAFFERWLEAVRSASDDAVRDVQVLMRPHPIRAVYAAWIARELDRRPGVRMWPRDLSEALSSPRYYSDYADSIRHCAVAVGLNTSSMVEVAIFGKAVCTWEDGPLSLRQHQTLHYRHLLHAGGGLLHVATSAPEHVEQLGRFLREAATGTPNARSASFVAAFVRPRGLDRAVAPIMASEIAELASAPSRVAVPGPVGRAIGRACARIGFVLGLPLRDHPPRTFGVRVTSALVLAWARTAGAWEERRKEVAKSSRRLLRRSRKKLERTKGAIRLSRRRLRRGATVAYRHARRAARRSSTRVLRSRVRRVLGRTAPYALDRRGRSRDGRRSAFERKPTPTPSE